VKPAIYHLPQPESYAAKGCGMQKYMLPAQALLRVGRKDDSHYQSFLFQDTTPPVGNKASSRALFVKLNFFTISFSVNNSFPSKSGRNVKFSNLTLL